MQNTIDTADKPAVDTRQRTLLMTFRQAVIMILGAIEDYLEIERSIVPKHRRL